MTTQVARKAACTGCNRTVSVRAINREHGVCGQCVRDIRDTERGYSHFAFVQRYECGFCGRATHDTTAMQVVIDGRLCHVDYDCLLDRQERYPDAAAYCNEWLGELRAYHAQEDVLDEYA